MTRTTRVITPPGSNAALGLQRSAGPRGITPLSYSPQRVGGGRSQEGLTTQGEPGKGPGFALADHIHPPLQFDF